MKSKGLERWKEASMTEARWPLRTATGSGGDLLLILASTSNEDGVVSFWGFWLEIRLQVERQWVAGNGYWNLFDDYKPQRDRNVPRRMEGFWAVGDFNNFLKFYYIYKIYKKKKLEKGGLINIMDVLFYFIFFFNMPEKRFTLICYN